MPEYAFKCSDEECGVGFFRVLTVGGRNAPQECPTCEGPSEKQVAAGVGGVLRGDAWPGKNIQVKKQMAARRARVGEREHQLKMDGPQFNLAPNVGGERVDSWEDAAKMAASKGKSTEEYERRARAAKNRGRRT